MSQSRFLYVFSVAAAALLIVGALLFGVVRMILASEVPATETRYLYIERGSGLLRASYLAKEQELVKARWHFLVAARMLGMERNLQAGEYEISASLTLKGVFDKINQGERYLRRLVVPEGLSAKEIDGLLRTSFGLDLKGLSTAREGTLLPDTYFYERGDPASRILSRMQAKQDALLDSLWGARAEGLPFDTVEEALTLASIVEKETGIASERALVAAVFVNRLKKGMRLQSDPTVIYGITEGLPLGRAITRSDLREMTAYNTYRISGLPPTPIANPGEDAIRAVLNPADVPYLYFVADGTGGHAFAVSLDDHNRNVARWRQYQRNSRP